MNSLPLIIDALDFAAHAHRDQRRKGGIPSQAPTSRCTNATRQSITRLSWPVAAAIWLRSQDHEHHTSGWPAFRWRHHRAPSATGAGYSGPSERVGLLVQLRAIDVDKTGRFPRAIRLSVLGLLTAHPSCDPLLRIGELVKRQKMIFGKGYKSFRLRKN